MATDISEVVAGKVDLKIADVRIDEMRDRLADLPAQVETKEGYELVRLGIAECRELRLALDDNKETLKRPVIDYGRAIDKEYNRLKEAIEKIEKPLKEAKQKVDDERERVKREALEAERRAQQEAERKRREAEQAEIDRQRAELAKQQEALDAQRRAQEQKDREIREAQEKIEHEKREAARKQQEAIDRAEWERNAKLRAEQQAAEKAEQDRLANEREEAARKERVRLEMEAAPDIDKLARYAAALKSIETPSLRGTQAMRALFRAQQLRDQAIECLMSYQGEFNSDR